MAVISAVSWSQIVLFFGNITGTPSVRLLSDNSRYEFIPPADNEKDEIPCWRKYLAEDIAEPIFCLKFGENMYTPQGWDFGSFARSSQSAASCSVLSHIPNSLG